MRPISFTQYFKAKVKSFLAFGVLASTTSSVFSQIAPIAPPAGPPNAKSNSGNLSLQASRQVNNSPNLQQAKRVALERADQAIRRGNFDEAIFFFRLGAIPPQDWKNEEDTKAHRGLLAAYSGIGDMETSLFYANAISRKPSFADSHVHLVLGLCHQELSQSTAAIDFFRLAASKSDDEETSRILAMSLSQTLIPSLRNGQEAMIWLAEHRDLAERDPRLTKAFALAASECGDFELAIAMQRSLIDRIPQKDKAMEKSLITQYEKRQKTNHQFPAFDRTQVLSREKLADRARKSTVYVRVSGLATDGVTDEESTIVKVVKHDHMGIALNKMGTILISSESTALPNMIDGDLSSPKAKRWVKEPSFTVRTNVDSTGSVLELGKASLIGVDHETGLAVLQCDRLGEEHEPIAEIEPVRFQLEHRWYNPAWLEYAKSYFELNDFELVEREGGRLETRSYPLLIENPPVFGTTAQFVECDQSRAPIGAPLLNAFGECIGLVRSIENIQSKRVAVPSAVCSRVSSKLCAFGFVPRVQSPMVVSSVSETRKLASGKDQVVQSGMYVSQIRSQNPALTNKNSPFQNLVDQVILSVDGYPTPTNTEWLIALERIAFAGWEGKSIDLKIVDTEWKNQRTVQVRFAPATHP